MKALTEHELDNIARHANPTAKSAPMPGWWGIFAVQLEQIAKAIK